MAQTASRTKSAKPAAASKTAPVTTEIDLGRRGSLILNKLANARTERLKAEREEKPLKEQLKELYADAAEALKLGDILVIKASGTVRGRVTKRFRKNVDVDLLMQAFPEAYEACVSDGEYLQFDAS